jgi:CheY-like chemotaxis protein
MRPIHLLLVEDDLSDAQMIQSMVRRMNGTYSLTAKRTLHEASEFLASDEVDVILSDLSLPDGSALGTVTRLREACPHKPIIVLTGNDDEELAVKTVASDAQDYLVKWDFNHHDSKRLVLVLVHGLRPRPDEKGIKTARKTARSSSSSRV